MSKPIIVVGAGRCGTSLVAGMLDKLGVYIGDTLVPADKNNPVGHWEDLDFKNLNLALMRNNISSEQFKTLAKKLIKEKSKREYWGWKVPSTGAVLDNYLDVLEDAKIIYCRRDKEDIVNSMQKSYNWSRVWCLELIERRLKGIKNNIDRVDNMTIGFDNLMKNTEGTLKKIIKFVDIEVTIEDEQRALALKREKLKKKPKVWISILNQGSIRPELSNVLTIMTHDNRVQLHMDYPNRKPEVQNRNEITKKFLDSGYDFQIMIDADVIPKRNPLDLVFLNKDVVNFAAPQWRNDPDRGIDLYWVALDKDEDKGWKPFPPRKRRSLQQVDATGQACIVIKREVIEDLDEPYYQHIWDKTGCIHQEGLEYNWCERVKGKGFKIWVHFDYFASHFKKIDLLELAKLLGGRNGKSDS